MMTLLLREVGLDEHHKEALRRVALRRHPDLREAEEEPLYTTAEALERKRAEFEQITRTDIPHNAEEIRKAAAHGDLRENFEYKAAREKHTARGKMLRFALDEVAELSGPGRGVILMRPSKEGDDRIVGGLALPAGASFLAVTPEGSERKIALADVPAGKRAGKGQKVVKRGGVAALRRADEVG